MRSDVVEKEARCEGFRIEVLLQKGWHYSEWYNKTEADDREAALTKFFEKLIGMDPAASGKKPCTDVGCDKLQHCGLNTMTIRFKDADDGTARRIPDPDNRNWESRRVIVKAKTAKVTISTTCHCLDNNPD